MNECPIRFLTTAIAGALQGIMGIQAQMAIGGEGDKKMASDVSSLVQLTYGARLCIEDRCAWWESEDSRCAIAKRCAEERV